MQKALGLDPEYQFGRALLRAALVKNDTKRLRDIIKRAERGDQAAIATVVKIRGVLA